MTNVARVSPLVKSIRSSRLPTEKSFLPFFPLYFFLLLNNDKIKRHQAECRKGKVIIIVCRELKRKGRRWLPPYPKGMNVEACNGVCTNVCTHIYTLTVDTYSRWSYWDEKRLEGWERASSWLRVGYEEDRVHNKRLRMKRSGGGEIAWTKMRETKRA